MAESEVKITIAINDRTRGSLARVNKETERLRDNLKGAGAAANATENVGRQLTRLGRAAAAARVRVRGFFRSLRANAQASIVQLQALRSGFNRLRLSAAGLGAGFTALGLGAGLIAASDAALQANARIRIVADTEEDLIRIRGRLLAISNRTRTSFSENAKVFARLSIATEELGTSEETLLSIIQGVNKAVLLSGATAQEANAGIIQLTQGIASNRFQGDELRSVLENLVVVGDSLAKSLGTTIGGIRELGEAGELTRETLIPALAEIDRLVSERFERLPVTVGQAVTRIQNTLLTAFTGTEITPLVDALGELEQSLQDPATQAQLQSLARSAAVLAAGFVRAAPAIAGFISNLRLLAQVTGIVVGSFAEILILTRGNLFSTVAAFARGDIQEVVKIGKEAIDILFDDELQAQEDLIKDKEKFAQLENDIAVGTAAAKLKASQGASAAIKKNAQEETRVIETELRKQIALTKELTEELEELRNPKDTGQRGGDDFDDSLARQADLRKATRALAVGELEDARNIAIALLKEAESIDNVVERTNLENRAKLLLLETDAKLLIATKLRVAELKKEKEIAAAEAKTGTVAAEAAKRTVEDLPEEVKTLQEQGLIPAEVAGTVAAVTAEFAFLRDTTRELNENPISLKVDSNVPQVTTEVNGLNAALQNTNSTLLETIKRFAALATASGQPPDGPTATVGIRGATGGRIPGFGGDDKVPAMLERGEYIINKRSTRQNLGLLRAINRGNGSLSRMSRIPHFAEGGIVHMQGGGPVGAKAPVNITLPGGPTLQLSEGADSVESIKRTIANEALKRGRRIT